MEKPKAWKAPHDLDRECLELCIALNALPDIHTGSSCCGHGKEPYRIFLSADTLDALRPVAYYLDCCHSGCHGWQLIVHTDCAMGFIAFYVEGPPGQQAYDDSQKIAENIMAYVRDEL